MLVDMACIYWNRNRFRSVSPDLLECRVPKYADHLSVEATTTVKHIGDQAQVAQYKSFQSSAGVTDIHIMGPMRDYDWGSIPVKREGGNGEKPENPQAKQIRVSAFPR